MLTVGSILGEGEEGINIVILKVVDKATGKRKGAMGIAHILDARMRKDGLTLRQAVLVAEKIASVVATGHMKSLVQVGGTFKAIITDGRYAAVLVKEPGMDVWLLTGWESK